MSYGLFLASQKDIPIKSSVSTLDMALLSMILTVAHVIEGDNIFLNEVRGYWTH